MQPVEVDPALPHNVIGGLIQFYAGILHAQGEIIERQKQQIGGLQNSAAAISKIMAANAAIDATAVEQLLVKKEQYLDILSKMTLQVDRLLTMLGEGHAAISFALLDVLQTARSAIQIVQVGEDGK